MIARTILLAIVATTTMAANAPAHAGGRRFDAAVVCDAGIAAPVIRAPHLLVSIGCDVDQEEPRTDVVLIVEGTRAGWAQGTGVPATVYTWVPGRQTEIRYSTLKNATVVDVLTFRDNLDPRLDVSLDFRAVLELNPNLLHIWGDALRMPEAAP